MERRNHWLRKNAANRIPRRVVTFDCEAYRNKSKNGERHTFRLATASFDTLNADGKAIGETEWLETESAGELWYFVTDFTSTGHRTVVFAHNLSYDLRLSSALTHLPTLGFVCQGIALTSFSCWARFKKGTRSLWLCDSFSYAPTSLEKIAQHLQLDKPPLPEDGEANEVWLERCYADTRATREAVLRILRYIKKEDLGDFRLTGSAQATAAFRHRHLPEKTLLVHDNEQALEAERKAAWSGRAEVWRHGEYNAPVYEMDYQYAYARLAYDNMVPTKLVCEHSGIPVPRLLKVMEHYAVLANVRVTTSMPLVPADGEAGIIWPTGTFDTTLWDHELRLLLANGQTFTVDKYWQYKRGYLLRPWAKWIIELLEKPGDKLDPIVRLMLKDWSRSLIGRFGLRYSVLDEIGRTPDNDIRLFGVHDIDTNEETEYLQLGAQLFERMAREESPNSTPFVMSSIMSAARVRLWDAIEKAGSTNILYTDTDGIIVNAKGRLALEQEISRGNLRGLRCKARYNGGVFRSPRNIDLGEMRRVNGAPRKAERLSHGVYRGEVWQSLPTALKRGNLSTVTLSNRVFRVSDEDKRRVHLPNGKTIPIELTAT